MRQCYLPTVGGVKLPELVTNLQHIFFLYFTHLFQLEDYILRLAENKAKGKEQWQIQNYSKNSI